MSGVVPNTTVPNSEFLPRNPKNPRVSIQGNLTFTDFDENHAFHLELVYSTWTVVWPGKIYNPTVTSLVSGTFNTAVRQYLPNFNFQYVQDQEDLIPVARGPQPSTHPFYQYQLSPSQCWREKGDGDYDRCVLILAVNEKGNNCIYNGLGMFLIHKSTYEMSDMYFQFTQETCAYYKWDMWGFVPGNYTKNPCDNADQIIEEYEEEVEGAMKVKDIAVLAKDIACNNGENPNNVPLLLPNDTLFHPGDEITAVVYDHILYTSAVRTRQGPHPYPQWVIFPLYSLTKTNFASTLVGVLDQKRGCTFPATPTSNVYNKCILDLVVEDWVPEVLASGKYTDVTIRNFIDEATGVYNSSVYGVDEGSGFQNVYFFYRFTDAEKTNFSVSAWLPQQPGGEVFVYHTTDTYLETKALSAIINKVYPEVGGILEFHRQYYVDVLGLSPTYASPLVTDDDIHQPFGGYGTFGYINDYGRISEFWALSTNYGVTVNGDRLVSSNFYQSAQQMNPLDRGLPTLRVNQPPNQYYQFAWWSYDILVNCSNPKVNYQSGYGGIRMYIGNTVWSYIGINDDYSFSYIPAVNRLVDLGAGCPVGLIHDPYYRVDYILDDVIA